MLYSIMAVVLAIIVGTSVFCIKNSFDISVMGKEKELWNACKCWSNKKTNKKKCYY